MQDEKKIQRIGNMSDHDRRFFPRAEAPLEVQYSPGEELAPGDGKNLSAGGISFQTHSHYQKGDLLNLNLKLKGFERSIKARGKVLHSEPDGEYYSTAVIFTDIPYDDFITVLDYSLAHLDQTEIW